MAYLGKTIEREFYYGAGRDVIEKARILRKHMTSSENILWQHLRKKRLSGRIFRWQHPVGQFIVDFYCHEARFVIEVDGMIHEKEENKEYDEGRTYGLKKFGLTVLRFKNDDIENKRWRVLKILENEINTRINR